MADQGDVEERGADQRRWPGWLQISLLLLVILVALFFARAPEVDIRSGGEAIGSGKPQVTVLVPSSGSHALKVELTGEVRTEATVPLQLESAGRIVSVSPNLKEGGAFRAGEELVRVDTEDYERRVQLVKERLSAREAQLQKQQLKGARNSEKFQAENPGVAVPAIVQRVPQIARRQAQVNAARLSVEVAEKALKDTSLRLSYDGRVVNATAWIGQLASPSRPLGIAYSRDAIEVQVPIPTQDLAYLEPAIGRVAEIQADGRTYLGSVSRVSWLVDRRSRQAKAYIDFADNEPLETLPPPGTFIELAIVGPAFDNAYRLPEAVERVGGSVWVVDDGVLAKETPPLGSYW